MRNSYIISLSVFLFVAGVSISYSQPNTWISLPDYPGGSDIRMISFNIGNKIYAGTGEILTSPYIAVDIWQFDFVANSWSSKADYGGYPKRNATAFTINGLGYIVGGDYTDMWAYDEASNTWTQKSTFPGGDRMHPISFVIGDRGYFGLGKGVSYDNDFWEYNPDSNSWLQKASFIGIAREQAVGFAVAGFGFVGCGYDGSFIRKDFWKYDPINDSWIQISDFPSSERYLASCFTINNSAFVVGGEGASQIFDDCWQYNPFSDSWVQKASYLGGPIVAGVGCSANGVGFVGTGNTGGGNSRLCYKYIPDQSVNIQDPYDNSSIQIFNRGNSIFTLTGISNTESINAYDLNGRLLNIDIKSRSKDALNFSIPASGIFIIIVKEKNIVCFVSKIYTP